MAAFAEESDAQSSERIQDELILGLSSVVGLAS